MKNKVQVALGIIIFSLLSVLVLLLFHQPGEEMRVYQSATSTEETTALPLITTTEETTAEEAEELPVIHGVRDIYVALGATIAFRQGVTVTHSSGEATLEVDSSGVNVNEPGTYEVIFIARSPGGQEARATAKVTVGRAGEENAIALVAPILSEIIAPNMTQFQQARAIHTWAYNNITYQFTGPQGELTDIVYTGMTLRRGNCFTFYAITRFMLEHLGIETISMQRLPGHTNTTHMWLLVNVGYGWHHFDATNFTQSPHNGFMMTSTDIEGFNPWNWAIEFYAFDPNRLPPGIEIVS